MFLIVSTSRLVLKYKENQHSYIFIHLLLFYNLIFPL